MEQPTKWQLNCSICNKPIAFEIAKTDDSGQAVHEECYVFKVGSGAAELRSNPQNADAQKFTLLSSVITTEGTPPKTPKISS